MHPDAIPARITIDFRDELHPSRTWILGLDASGGRADLVGFEEPRPRPSFVARLATSCTCPDFCERDHANE